MESAGKIDPCCEQMVPCRVCIMQNVHGGAHLKEVFDAMRPLTHPDNKVLPRKKHRAAAMFLAAMIVATPTGTPYAKLLGL
jgi:hypothetical protein